MSGRNPCVQSRREFLKSSVVAASGLLWRQGNPLSAAGTPADLKLEIGVTTGSMSSHIRAGRFKLIDFPKIMRDELGMKVIDLMTATLESLDEKYADALRNQAEKHGCVLTNLKLNQEGMDLGSTDKEVHRRSMAEYKRSIDIAHRLGCRWVRPLPRSEAPDRARYVNGYRELIEYGAPQGVSLLIENFGWMSTEVDVIPETIRLVGKGLDACPDTGNWKENVRYDGLAKAYPLAVTCDFKFKQLTPAGEHPEYDLRRCFQIGWDAGFRGPWCFEHAGNDLPTLWKEFVLMRDRMRGWIGEQKA